MERSYYAQGEDDDGRGGDLMLYQTSAYLRRATRREALASREAAKVDGGAGVIGDDDLSRPVGRRAIAKAVRS